MKAVRTRMIHFNDTETLSEEFLNKNCYFDLVGC